jgi:hypothetical protein
MACFEHQTTRSMKHALRILLIPVLIGIAGPLQSQTLDIEKSYNVSKEATKGFLQIVENDEAKQQLTFVYRVRAKKNQAKFITYVFDYNFNMVDESEEIVDMEKELPAKYRPKKYKGEAYEVEGLFVEPNMMGTLVLKRKVARFAWNWFTLSYKATVSVEGKLKAKTDDEKKLFYHDHIEDLNNGTAMILTGEKGSPKEGPFDHMKNFHFIKYDINLQKLADVTVNFEAPQALVATYKYPQEEEDSKTDFVAVFATYKPKRGYVGPKIWGSNAQEYTYVRVSYDGKLKDKITFNSPNSIWRIDDFMIAMDGAVYFYGPSNGDKDEYFQSRLEVGGDKEKWPNFQLAKVADGKMQFCTSTSMEDFKTRLKPQPDGKKGEAYAGRRVAFTEAIATPNNDFILSGQNYGMNRNSKGQIVGREYEDLVMFHFDPKGSLISQYTMNKKKAALSPDYQFFEVSSDGKVLYWSFFDNIDTKTVKELDFVIDKPLGQPKMAKIDLATGRFDKYSEFGNGENFVHYATLNYLKFTNTNQVSFLGENKKGSTLWFARVNLDK